MMNTEISGAVCVDFPRSLGGARLLMKTDETGEPPTVRVPTS